MVRAALTSRVTEGPVQALLRQPAMLETISLPTGTVVDGRADPLPDGRFLLRFDSFRRSDGSAQKIKATALVDASAAARRPLIPGAKTSFEFDLMLAAAP